MRTKEEIERNRDLVLEKFFACKDGKIAGRILATYLSLDWVLGLPDDEIENKGAELWNKWLEE